MGLTITGKLEGCLKEGRRACWQLRHVAVVFTVATCLSHTPVYAQEPASAGDALDAINTLTENPLSKMTAQEAMRAGARAYYNGDKTGALVPLEYAAKQGQPMAAWKLGRMYAEGDGVPENDITAFRYFSRIAHDYGETAAKSAMAPFVSHAIVSLAAYYNTGIAGSSIHRDPNRARELYSYAATIYGDAEAQYRLALFNLQDTQKVSHKAAARWLKLAANKGHIAAQAKYGELLFFRGVTRRSKSHGLNWIALANAQATSTAVHAPEHVWILDLYTKAQSQASEDDRLRAAHWSQEWLRQRTPVKAIPKQASADKVPGVAVPVEQAQ